PLTKPDGAVTAVTMGSSKLQVARGSRVSDASGARQATLLFPSGTTAQAPAPGGGMKPVGSLHVRLTEFTVGDNGPAAMPGDLPPASEYTYAVELSADEASDGVTFNQPVPLYVDNFLHFPPGAP